MPKWVSARHAYQLAKVERDPLRIGYSILWEVSNLGA